jgi:hypothetical protein
MSKYNDQEDAMQYAFKFRRVIDTVEPIDEEHITLLILMGYEQSLVGTHYVLYSTGETL